LHDPRAQRLDETGLFRQRDEALGGNEAELRVSPAHQRFQTENFARADVTWGWKYSSNSSRFSASRSSRSSA
jgi:hypothetical protein